MRSNPISGFIYDRSFIADMLYNGHHSIEDTHFKNKVKLTMVISVESNPHYRGSLSIEDTILSTNGVHYLQVHLYIYIYLYIVQGININVECSSTMIHIY